MVEFIDTHSILVEAPPVSFASAAAAATTTTYELLLRWFYYCLVFRERKKYEIVHISAS